MNILSAGVRLLAVPFAIVEDVLTFIPRSAMENNAKPRTLEVIEKAAEDLK